jgi:hypothetical protein
VTQNPLLLLLDKAAALITTEYVDVAEMDILDAAMEQQAHHALVSLLHQ